MRRRLNLAKNILLSNFKELDMPYRMTYIVTYKCQLTCTMCNIWKRSSYDELSLEEIEKFFTNYNKFAWINLSGGEIFLRDDIVDIVGIIHRKCKGLYLLDFPTNGFATELIIPSVRSILSSYDIPKVIVTVSLDGPKEVHDRIRGVPGSWERAVATFNELKALRSKHFNVFFGLTLQGSNIDSFDAAIESVRYEVDDISYDDFHVNVAHESGHYYANTELAKGAGKEVLWRKLDEIVQKRKVSRLHPIGFLEYRYQTLAKNYLDTRRMPVACAALGASLFMDPCGNIYPCSIFDKRIGNIRDFGYDLNKIWGTEARRSLRAEIVEERCPGCWTPCEAYQSILAGLLPRKPRRKRVID